MEKVPSPDSRLAPALHVAHGHTAVAESSERPEFAIAHWEIFAFGILCVADMLSTVYWYKQGIATEANPLLAFWLKRSVEAFCIAKLASFLPLLIVCAYYRNSSRYSRFITKALRIAMAAYVGIYLFAIAIQYIG